MASRALSMGWCSPQTAWGHDTLAQAVQARCVHKVAGAWATYPVLLTGTTLRVR